MGVTFKKGNAFPKGRRFIGLIWQDLAHAAFFLSNVAESVDDEPCFINKDDVAVFSCQFKNQFFCDDLAFPANQIDAYDKNAVKAQLRDGRNAGLLQGVYEGACRNWAAYLAVQEDAREVSRGGNPRIDQ